MYVWVCIGVYIRVAPLARRVAYVGWGRAPGYLHACIITQKSSPATVFGFKIVFAFASTN